MPRPTSPSITALADALTERLDEFTDELVDRITDQIEFYRGHTVVPRADLRRSVRHNLAYLFATVTDHAPQDLAPPQRTGRERAHQGAPLPDVLHAYRLGFGFIWKLLLDAARRSGPRALDGLLDIATEIWSTADDYSTALTDSYRAAAGEMLIAADRRRSALVAALLTGTAEGARSAWEIAKLLDIPYEGAFVVVVGETPELGRSAFGDLEARLRALDVRSAWRTMPDHEVGVLSYGRRRSMQEIRAVIDRSADARIGISPQYSRLDRTPGAFRFAQIALETLEPGVSGVRQLRDTPLAELVMGNLDTTRRFVRRVLGRVLTMSDDDRSTMITTAEAWLDAHRSYAAAGHVLYCHENTVRYRMRRLEEHLDGELDDPTTIAELEVALQAIRTFPELGARIPPGDAGT